MHPRLTFFLDLCAVLLKATLALYLTGLLFGWWGASLFAATTTPLAAQNSPFLGDQPFAKPAPTEGQAAQGEATGTGVGAAVGTPLPNNESGGLMQMIFSLSLVLLLVVAVLYAIRKRYGLPTRLTGHPIQVVAWQALGPKEKVVVVEFEQQWIMIGLAPGEIRALHTMPKPASASTLASANAGKTATPASKAAAPSASAVSPVEAPKASVSEDFLARIKRLNRSSKQ